MKSLLIWMVLIVIPSGIGGISYLDCRRAKELTDAALYLQNFGGPLTIFIAFVMACQIDLKLQIWQSTFDISGVMFGSFMLLVGYLSCSIGGWAHTKTVGTIPGFWGSSRFLVYSATILSLLAGIVAVLPMFMLAGSGTYFLNYPGYWAFYALSLVISPALMPFLIWAEQNMKLQPGVDKHFDE